MKCQDSARPLGSRIQLCGATFAYPQNPAKKVIDEITLDINRGEFFAILGRSGCGKTTLLKLLGGLLDPSSGSITIEGLSPTDAKKQRIISFVFQSPALLPWKTVIQNVALPYVVAGASPPWESLLSILDDIGIRDLAKKRPNMLSGGERSRVAIARALSYAPQVLLMDEPFANLDEITRRYLNDALVDLWNLRCCTIVFVTHSITEAMYLADRIAVFDSRSGRFSQIVQIPFANRLPRCRTSTDFAILYEQLMHALDYPVSSKEEVV
jgi:NitT/TauT family transport system ATP-binding protein